MAVHLNSPACLCQGGELSWEFRQSAVAVPCVWGGPCASAGRFMGAAESVWPHTKQEQSGIKCLEDILIILRFVILLLKLMRIKSYLHNKNEYDGVR